MRTSAKHKLSVVSCQLPVVGGHRARSHASSLFSVCSQAPKDTWFVSKGSFILAAVCLLFGLNAFAYRPPKDPHTPNFDKRLAEHPPAPELAAEKKAAADRLKELVPDVAVQVDRIRHAPNFVTSPQGFLSGPEGKGKGISEASARAFRADDPHQPIKSFLQEHAPLFGHGPEVLSPNGLGASARITRDYKTAHNNLQTTIWQQQLDDIDIFEAVLMGHVTAKRELVNISTHFLANPQKAADAGLPDRKLKQQKPPVSAKEALSVASKAVEEEVGVDAFSELDPTPAGAELKQRFKGEPTFNEAAVRLVWLPMSAEEMRLAWLVRLVSRNRGEGFHRLIDADSSELLIRRSITEYLTNATYNVYTSDSPSPFSPGLSTPGTFQPPLVPRTLLNMTAISTNASPLGWINDADNETRWNNVDAHLDRDKNDQPDLPRPTGNPRRVFDFPLDLTMDPTTYGNAAVVNLFYWCNFMHDQTYELGFTEAAGNFQNNNFGRGGLGNDAIQADAQDGSGFNNANYTPAYDGSPGRIQMYIFDFPFPRRDGDLDAEVMCHEYTHGVSDRLVGGGVLISELQTAGMGEGWSDFYAMALLSEPGDDVDAAYASGGYASYQLGFLNENYYYGIRHYPYSTDLTKSPLTFKDIDPGQISPHTGVPLSPLYSPFTSFDADEVHHQGEVWCVTLWEARANLIKKWGYAIGNKLILQLVTDGMKLGPANPNFLQARDAIIQADQVNSGGANYNDLWAAFAKRGMGGSASSPPSYTTAGVVEAFDVPGLALKQTRFRDTLTGNGNNIIDANECVELFVTLLNNGRRAANNISATLVTSTPGVQISQADSAYPLIPIGATATNITPFRFFVSPAFYCGAPIEFSLTVRSDQDTRVVRFRLNSGAIGPAVQYDSNVQVPIPDADPAGIDSTIAVSDFQGTIGKVTVSFFVTHTWDGDLVFQLIGPDGTRVLLSSHNGFFYPNYGQNCTPPASRTTFDDDAATPITAGRAPFVGTFRPQQPLAAFVGKSGLGANGNWRLHMQDDFFFDFGTLQCWTLKLHPTVCGDGGGECSTDLSISTSVSPTPPLFNSNMIYSVVATNRGPIASANVYVTNTLPSGITFISASSSRGICSQTNGVITCALGALPPNTVATVTIRGQPTVVGYVTNTATVVGSIKDSNLTNNTDTLITFIPPPTPLMVAAGAHMVSEASPANGGIDPGETVTIDLFLRNVGTGAASNLVATLVAGNGVSPISGPQTYGNNGYVPLNSPPVSRPFAFTATGTNAEIITLTLHVRDGTNDLPDVIFQFGLHAVFSFSNPSVINVPGSGEATLYPSTIFVSGIPGVVSRVTVSLSNITHTFVSDLDVLLVAPNGRTALLMSDAGGAHSVNNVTVTLDDFVPDLLPEIDAVSTGSYRPTDYDGGDGDPFTAPAPAGPYGSSLSALSGSNPNGRWSLYVFDDTPGDSGRIGGWSLTLETSDPVDATADLALTATGSATSVPAGSNILYTVTIGNQGPDDAIGVVLASQLPAGAVFVSAETGLGTCSNSDSVVTCDIGNLANQDQVLVTIEATMNKSGTATASFSVSAQESDPNSANNSAVVTTSVTQAADVGIVVSASPNPAVANQNLVLTLVVTNSGPDRAFGVTVTNRLPLGMPIVSISPSQNVSTNGNVVTWNAGIVSNAVVTNLTITLRPPTAGIISNWAQVKASLPEDRALVNNSNALVLTVSDGPIVISPAGTVLLSESFAPPSGGIDPGEQVSVSFALRNIGISNATDLTATLLSGNGISSPSGPQNYGALTANGPSVARTFSFTASGPSGGTISAIFDLAEGGANIGRVSFPFVLGGSRSFSNLNQITIRDNASALPYPSTISVSGLTGVVGNVTVNLINLTHDFPDDLDILLVAPSGQNVLLMSDACGPVQVANVNVTFDQSGPPLPDSDPLVSGTFRPTDYFPPDSFPPPAPSGTNFVADFSRLNGINPNGTWSLYIRDDDLGASGQLGGWSLNITTVGQLTLPPGITDVRLSNGQIQFTITGQPGDRVSIESSPDFVTWTEASNRVLGASGNSVFTSPTSADNLFYRVRRTQ